MARDPVTGRFTSKEATLPAALPGDAAIDAMKKFTKSITSFTKNVAAPGAVSAAKTIGSAGLRGAKGAGGIVNARRKEAGFTQSGINDKLLGNHPILHAIAGGGMDMMNMMGRGVKKGAKGIIGKTGAKEDKEGAKKGAKATEDQREDRAILERISDNVEKIASGADGSGGGAEPAKKGGSGILGMLAGLGGMLAMGGGGGVLGKVFGAIGNVFTKLGAIAKAIPALVTKAMPFIKQGAKFFKQIFKRLFWPVTALIGIFSFVDGFIAGYQEGGLVEGFKQGIESLFNNLIDAPLNMLKDAVAWIMGVLGFENIEKALNSFDFDIGGMLADGFQFLVDFFQDIPDMMKDIVISLAHSIGGERFGGAALDLIGIDVEEHEKNKKAKKASRAERAARTEARRSGASEEESGEAERLRQGGRPRINGVVPLDDEDAEFLEEMHKPSSADEEAAEFLERFDVGGEQNKKPRKKESAYQRKRRKMKARRTQLSEKARQIEAAGGTTGRFERGKLVEVDGKPYTAPELTPAPDSRAGAAAGIQDAGISSSSGSGKPTTNVIQNTNTVNQGGKSTLAMPPPSMDSDPSLGRYQPEF
jgi:hypothetical protein